MKAIYKAVDIALLGLRSLTVHKVRSLLTALGILFGVWSVIAMLAISEGASYQSQLHLREMGSANIIVRSVKPPQDSGATAASRGALIYGLTRQDVACLRGNLPGVQKCVSTHQTLRYAHANGKNVLVTLIATEPSYADVVQMDMEDGWFIRDVDVLRHRPHCVVTRFLADRLFAYEDPLGQTVRVAGEPLVIVGILSRLPRTLAEGVIDAGSCVIIPQSTDRSRFGEYSVVVAQGVFMMEKVDVSQVILQMADEKAVLEGAEIARSLMKRRHEESDYETIVPRELLEQIRKQSRLWSIVFMVIASVSLVVGGIGIMNIMLASVTERTREIGIRRALGAKRTDIIVQFLVESVTLTTVGGVIGIAIGITVPWGVEKLLNFMTIVTASTLLVPFLMAVVVGLASGLYPALRAAKLDPIVALRHE
jgi:putative ABC transport system permease protein